MLKRQLLFFVLLAAPVVFFSIHRPVYFAVLLVSAVGAWWAASPVSYPRWITHGLVRAVPLAVVESLALWTFTR
jgi:hypothetical protein